VRGIVASSTASIVILAAFAVDLKAHLHLHHHPANPLASTTMNAYLQSRTGTVTAAVEDLKSGQTWLLHSSYREQTASIMKADILETLLRQAQMTNTPLSQAEASAVDPMIEDSNDQDAQALWNQLNGSEGVGAFNLRAGLTQTSLDAQGYWGESLTSGLDQIRLLRQLVLPQTLLNAASKSYELGLMEHIASGQAWGVTAGVPSNVTVALKNGWVPLTSDTDWEINSIGFVSGLGRRYLIAVLTAHDPSEAYGITTIEGVSKLVWQALS
jgi:hypothetical protein